MKSTDGLKKLCIIFVVLLSVAFIFGCSGGSGDDDSNASDTTIEDDGDTSSDDDITGDDDTSSGDDTSSDDDITGDDDTSSGDETSSDDDTSGDDDTSSGDDTSGDCGLVLCINEFMADNKTVLEDPDGTDEYPDWIELYNSGDSEIDLMGFYVTDDLTDPTKYQITENIIIPASGYGLLYADGTDQGSSHIGIKLGSSGEDIAIYDTDGVTIIDSYTFGGQISDVSEGRCPDGGDDWTFFTNPTPGIANGSCSEGIPDGWTAETHGNDADPDYDVVFDQYVVNRIDIAIANDDWESMLEDMEDIVGTAFGEGGRGATASDGTEPIWVPCTFEFDGLTWWYVGLRFKGNSSLSTAWQNGILKLPFRIDFDEFEDEYPEIINQRFYGFKKLTLSSNAFDDSLLREKVAADVFREAGLPAPETAFYRLYVDVGDGDGPVYFGLYTMVEVPDDPMLDTQFGNSSGNLYKPEGNGASFAEGEFDEDDFEKDTNETEADWRDIESIFEALHSDDRTVDPTAWRNNLDLVFNTEQFLRWLGINTVIENWDTYGKMTHNYYLYGNTGDGERLTWIPWDNNEAFGLKNPLSLYLTAREVDDDWPLIRYLMDDTDGYYEDQYLAFVNELITGVFLSDYSKGCFREAYNLIEPYVIDGNTILETYTYLDRASDFTRGLSDLEDHVDDRNADATSFLSAKSFAGSSIMINEIHYNPSLELQGEDDLYEFIELYNSGSSGVDLSGYTFSDGIDYTFEAGASIDAGGYIIVAKNSTTYSGLGCPVFQWTEGFSLSNGGEAIQLSDADGVQIDYVIYDDASPWPEAPDGTGFSLEFSVSATTGNALAENWKSSNALGGSPGASNE